MSMMYISRLPLYILLCALSITDWLSQCIQIAGTTFGHFGIPSKKFYNHAVLSPYLSNAMSSDSIVDLVVTVCHFSIDGSLVHCNPWL